MSFAALQAAWGRWFLDGLLAAGVRRVVVSPGSRSTPLVLAVARAEAAGRLAATVVVDERAAGFVALGQARATGEPSLLVCTSGTAGAHYLPAVVEAAESRIPLLIVTADRPPELRGRGAAQTIDQPGMFGGFVRRSFEVGPAEADPRAVDGLLRTGGLAAHAARWPDPGPVHLNVAFRKPLEPEDAEAPGPPDLERRVADALRAGLRRPDEPLAVARADVLDAVADRIAGARRGVLVLGPCAPDLAPSADTVARLVRATGFPVLAEATSQHRFGDTVHEPRLDVFEPLFGSPRLRERLAPDFVLQVGNAPTGRQLGQWIAASGVERVVLASHGIPEAFNQAARVVIGNLERTVAGLAERLGRRSPQDDGGSVPAPPARVVDPAWRDAVARVAGRARTLAAEAAGPGTQGEAMRAAVASVPADGLLVLGNSMPVRDVDLYVPAASRRITVLAQRGASGIDGLVAGAAGAASASGRPTVLLLGDVSFQHDVGALAVAAALEVPLVVVVVSNGGGRLFELLPVRGLPGVESTFDRFFLTPPTVDPVAASAAFGVPAARVEHGRDLAPTLADALARPGATVVEVVVRPDAPEVGRGIARALDAEFAD